MIGTFGYNDNLLDEKFNPRAVIFHHLNGNIDPLCGIIKGTAWDITCIENPMAIICPKCVEIKNDKVILTEKG